MKGTVKARYVNGTGKVETREVEAELVGEHWAVHKSLDQHTRWSLLHVPTERRVGRFHRKNDALAAARQLRDNLEGEAWGSSDHTAVSSSPELATAREIIDSHEGEAARGA